MATCASVDSSGFVHSVAGDPTTCPGPVLLSASEYVDFLGQLVAFGWDQSLFEITFAGGIGIFVVGFVVGLLISIVRKVRI